MSNPFDLRPSAIVDFPAPGIPVRQTISFDKFKIFSCSLVYEGTGNYYKDMIKKSVMRTFVAVDITNDSALHSIKKIQTELKINAKPVELQNLHFTLLFLGDVVEESLVKIKNALQTLEFRSFDITFTHVGAFPKPTFPRIVWIGIDQNDAEELTNLASKVVKILSPLGFKPDKPFKPHVTIFRVKNKVSNISDGLKKINPFSFKQTISEIKLKNSILTSTGPLYSDLQVVSATQ